MSNQSLMALGALVIYGFISIQFNSTILENSSTEIEDKVYLTAFSLADDLIEEIKEKAYDEKTLDFQAIAASQLTTYYALTYEAGETWPNFDDIDDYNNYNKLVDLPHAEGYDLTCNVNYVDSNGNNLTAESFYKKVTITVTSDYMRYPLHLSFIFSLHSKN